MDEILKEFKKNRLYEIVLDLVKFCDFKELIEVQGNRFVVILFN